MEKAMPGSAIAGKQGLPAKELFQFLFEELKGIYDGYKKYVFTTTATQVVAIGWFVTSDNAVKSVNRLQSIGYVFYGVILFCILIEAWVSFYLCSRSKTIARLIKELDFIEDKYYNFKILETRIVTRMLLSHIVLYILLAAVFHSFKA